MSDWPGLEPQGAERSAGFGTSFTSLGFSSGMGQQAMATKEAATGGAVWLTANSSRYCPVYIQQTVTVFQMGVIVTAQSGNCDVGIYDEFGTKLVSSGTTAVAAAGYQAFNIADTVLVPGTYYLAMGCDNVTAAFHRIAPGGNNVIINAQLAQTVYPLPTTWTTPVGVNHVPLIIAHAVATV